MSTILVCLCIALLSAILCFIVEKWDKIPFHIDKHRDAILAALTGGTAAFFASLFIILLTNLFN
jgi:hypothetical protein